MKTEKDALPTNRRSPLRLPENVDFVTRPAAGESLQRPPARAAPSPNRPGQQPDTAHGHLSAQDTGPEAETSMDEASLEGLAGQLRPRRAAAPCPPSAYCLPHHARPLPRTRGALISDGKKPGVPEVHWELLSLISQNIQRAAANQ